MPLLLGGNIDIKMVGRFIQHGLAAQGRYLVIHTLLPDRPGELLLSSGTYQMASAIPNTMEQIPLLYTSRRMPRLRFAWSTRFGWPAVATSQVREHGESLGAELERREQAQRVMTQADTGRPPAAQQGVPRQPPKSDRLPAAPDGVMDSCTTTCDEVSGKAVWRELSAA